MDISFWLDYRHLREGYTIHYDYEDVNVITGEELPVPDGSRYTKELYLTFCNIMSVDFNKVMNRIELLKESFHRQDEIDYGEEEIIFILRNISPVLCDTMMIYSFVEAVFGSEFDSGASLTDYFDAFKTMQNYVKLYIEQEEMRSLNTYTMFVNNALYSDIPKNIINLKAIESGDYRKYRRREKEDVGYDCISIKEFQREYKENDPFIMHYLAENPLEFLIASMYEIVRNGYLIKRCNLCGKLFVPYNRADTIYCDRPSPKDRRLTCKKYGSQKLWYDELKQDETKRLARNIYQSKQMLVRRNPDIVEYQKSFEKYKEQLKQWKEDVKAGVKTDAEYMEWLNQVKGKKVL